MNIRYVGTADFRRSELTNLNILFQERPELKTLGNNDAVMFINYTHTQLLLILGIYTVTLKGVPTHRYVRSERVRMLDGQVWNPLMVTAYNTQCGTGFSLASHRAIARILKPLKNDILKQAKTIWQAA